MDPLDSLSVPFLTRKMLSFEHGATFSLRIITQSRVAATLTIRGFTREGPFTFIHTTDNSGTEALDTFRIPDLPIMVTVSDENALFGSGTTYARLDLMMGGNKLISLASGPVYMQKSLSWPYNASEDIVPGHGGFRRFSGTDPGAGVEIEFQVPPARIYRLIAFSATLVTSATASNRRVHLRITDDASYKIDSFSEVDQVASTTINYSCAQYGAVPDSTDNGVTLIPIPHNQFVTAGDYIRTNTANLQVGDDWGQPSIMVEEMPWDIA